MPRRASGDTHDPTHYQRLGLDPDATAQAIRKAFRALARQLHPDVNPAPDAAGRFAKVQAAYEVLSDPAQRREYDLALRRESARADGVMEAPARQAHYTWSNIAAPNASVAEPGPDEIERLWQTFFARRAGETDEPRAEPTRPKAAAKRRAKR